MPNTNEKKKLSKSKFWARILCLILALVMIGSMAYLAINLILQSVQEKKALEAAKTTTVEVTTTATPEVTTTATPEVTTTAETTTTAATESSAEPDDGTTAEPTD